MMIKRIDIRRMLDFVFIGGYLWFVVTNASTGTGIVSLQYLNLLAAGIILTYQIMTIFAQDNGMRRTRFLYTIPMMSYWIHHAIFYLCLLYVPDVGPIYINNWSRVLRHHLGFAAIFKERFVLWRDTNGLAKQ